MTEAELMLQARSLYLASKLQGLAKHTVTELRARIAAEVLGMPSLADEIEVLFVEAANPQKQIEYIEDDDEEFWL